MVSTRVAGWVYEEGLGSLVNAELCVTPHQWLAALRSRVTARRANQPTNHRTDGRTHWLSDCLPGCLLGCSLFTSGPPAGMTVGVSLPLWAPRAKPNRTGPTSAPPETQLNTVPTHSATRQHIQKALVMLSHWRWVASERHICHSRYMFHSICWRHSGCFWL